ncbi:MAG: hypothetical protein C4K47_09165 [Candidatus Thorarchaeota archaeon]|nr:MAG: hypothetical protein C4K47_09165 [Candidatus Thorarchaeota archaeon]
MIELTLILALSGVLLIMSALFRLRRFGRYKVLRTTLENQFDVSNLDLSGRTEYSNCFSHQWYIDIMRTTKHGRIGEWFQRQMTDRTIATFLWFAVLLGSAAMILGMVLISSIRLLQAGLLVLLFTLIVMVGSGGVNISEELLIALLRIKQDEYRRDDYPYVRIGMRTIVTWSVFCLVVGIVFLISAPFNSLLLDLVGTGVVLFGDAVLWGPMFSLFNVWAPLGVVYISLVVPFIFIIIPVTIYMLYQRIRFGPA